MVGWRAPRFRFTFVALSLGILFLATFSPPSLASLGPVGVAGASTFAGSSLQATNSTAPAFPVWTNLTPQVALSPPARIYDSMAYDPALGGELLFGGQTPNAYGMNDTWLFANGTWTDLTSRFPGAPTVRWGSGLTYDPAYGGVILFGGRLDNGNVFVMANDTWVLNSTGWHQLVTPRAPSPRTVYYSMIYDPLDSRVVLFGGNYGTQYRMNDTWTFQNGTWTNISASLSTAPPKYQLYGTFDAHDGYGLFFGGSTWSSGGYGLTWSFSGGQWVNRTGASSARPDGVTGSPSIAYDPYLQVVVDFGGQTSSYASLVSTWTYQSGNWTNVTADVGGSSSPGVDSGTMAYDPGDHGVVVFGGDRLVGGQTSRNFDNSTWVLSDRLIAVVTAGPSLEGEGPLTVDFHAAVGPGPGPFSFTWTFGDGTANSTFQNTSHTFTSPGTYLVTLVVSTPKDGNAAASLNVSVLSPLVPRAEVAPVAGTPPLFIVYHANATGGLAPYGYEWTFGAGLPDSNRSSGSVDFGSPGTYPVSVVVTDALGDQAIQTFSVSVFSQVTAVLSAPSTRGLAPYTFSATVAAAGGVSPYTYLWSFGDGSAVVNGTSSSTHTFLSAGTFNVSVEVAGPYGDDAWSNLTVEVGAAPHLTAVANATRVVVGGAFWVNASASGGWPPWSYAWPSLPASCQSSPNLTSVRCDPKTAGTYSILVQAEDADGDIVSASANVTVVSSPTAPPSPTGTSSGPGLTLYDEVAIGAATVLAAAVTFLLVRRRRPPAATRVSPPRL